MRVFIKLYMPIVILVALFSCQSKDKGSVIIPFILDHNRMLVDAEIQRKDGTWRKVRLWVDSGNPTFTISESLAQDLGFDLSAANAPNFKGGRIPVETPTGLKVGGFSLNTDSVSTVAMYQPYWLYTTMHNDGNLPSSILKKYHIVIDYPRNELTIAEPNSIKPQGTKSNAYINPETGIACMDAMIDGDSLCFALDMGASYSFVSEETLLKYSEKHPDWPKIKGTLGCANMWGWWPANEQNFPVVRLPQLKWGNEMFSNIGIVGVTKFSENGPTLGQWYSRKTAKPVDGFLGPNVLKDYRVEIDYCNNAIYFIKGKEASSDEMNLVGISVRELPDSTYQVLGVVEKAGKPCVEGVEPEDIIVSIDGFVVKGKTMGNVVDKLRGKLGDTKKILLNRNGKYISVEAKVDQIL